jgi:hypothetical protein
MKSLELRYPTRPSVSDHSKVIVVVSTSMGFLICVVGEVGSEKQKPRPVVCMDTSNGINLEEWAYAIASHGQGRVFLISAPATSSNMPAKDPLRRPQDLRM